MSKKNSTRLEKKLKLSDVYAISTGAMFSSGFFLLPGLAAANTGPSVFLAYFVAGILILPAMLSMAELSTAMPKAGGAYYYLDRSLGPVVGTIGGVGSWLALVFKSAFALIGMGAYLAIYIDIPITPLALALTVLFGIINVFGAKESAGLQKILVAALVSILFFYVIQGLFEVFVSGNDYTESGRLSPFFAFGYTGFLSTVGLVFVSYAGLTKVASVSEEIENPDRNIPLGMILSLLTATFIYVVGVLIMIYVLEPNQLRQDLTPVATSGEVFLDWLPNKIGLLLIVISAIAAFASTGNAGIMSASRYPLAMARDKLLPAPFAKISPRFKTPINSIAITVGLMLVTLLVFDVESVAKLASAFQLLIFGLINMAVIVMRESKIEGYDPGFKSPWYPWVQIFGLVVTTLLISDMGALAILFCIAVTTVSVVWFYFYAYKFVRREGAIYHVHERLGRRRYEGLDKELRTIVREKGLRQEDPFDEVVARAEVIEASSSISLDSILEQVAHRLSGRIGLSETEIKQQYQSYLNDGVMPIAGGVALPHIRVGKSIQPEMVLVRFKSGYHLDDALSESDQDKTIHAMIFFASCAEKSGQHLRILGQLAESIDVEEFHDDWMNAESDNDLRRVLIRNDRFFYMRLDKSKPSGELIGKPLKELFISSSVLIPVIKRDEEVIIPRGDTILKEGDRISIIGEPKEIKELEERFKLTW